MLIRQEIKVHLAAKRLIPVSSLAPWSGEPRAFLLTAELGAQMAAGRQNPATMERWAHLDADMAHFVEGGYINWGLMKWLDPQKQEVWELKSVRPKPSVRVFGRFAEPDVFVATNLAFRQDLKGKWSMEYWLEIFKCEEKWNQLFNCGPYHGQNYESYITENAGKRVRV